MNRLPVGKRAKLIQTLCEGVSLRATARLNEAAYNTVLKLQVEAGVGASNFHDETVRNLPTSWVQCDELWAFCHTKQRNIEGPAPDEYGDVYTWVAIDPATKLVISWWVGKRSAEDGIGFMRDLRTRLINPSVRISTDALKAYAIAVESEFGIEAEHEVSKPSTTHVERNNLSIRMGNRRFTRRTNAHSKKMLNHYLSVSLYFTYYNFCRPHMTLGTLVTPAMAAGLTEFPLSLEELAAIISN